MILRTESARCWTRSYHHISPLQIGWHNKGSQADKGIQECDLDWIVSTLSKAICETRRMSRPAIPTGALNFLSASPVSLSLRIYSPYDR